MTWTDHGGTSPEDRRTAVVVALVAATVVALAFVLPVDFALSYFMNDAVGPADHLRFLSIAAVAGLGLSVGYAVCVTQLTHLPLRRSAVGCGLVTAAVFSMTGAGYAGLLLSPALDYAIGSEASDTACVAVAVVLACVSAGAFIAGRRALSLR